MERREGKTMKTLILTVSTGWGHTATAMAIEARLRQMGGGAHTIDAYKYINNFISETLDKSTAIYTKVAPDIYRLVYDYLEGGVEVDQKNIFSLVNRLCSYKLARLVEDYDPDVIVCTHVFAAQLANELKMRGKTRARIVGIVTDYTIHPYWETVPCVDYVVTASEVLTYRGVKRGIPERRIKPLGVPVHPKFNESLSKEEARKKLGLLPEGDVVLMMGGGLGYGLAASKVERLLYLRHSFQLLIVCGKNKKQRKQFEKYRQEHGFERLHVYGFVDNVQEMMDAADILVSKPGGLTVSEALAKKLPMVVVNPIAGHEERNLEFLLNCGLAVSATKTFPLDEAVNLLLSIPRRREEMRRAIETVAKPHALEDICQFITTLQVPGHAAL